MNRKAVFLDVDGTLINDYGQVPASAVAAIHEAQHNGHLVFVCTGRSMVELVPEITELGFDGYVVASGAFVQIGSDVLRHERLSPEAARHVADFFDTHGGGYYFQANDRVYSSVRARDHLRAVITAEVAGDPAFTDVQHGLLTYVETIEVTGDPYDAHLTKAVYFDAPVSIDEIRAEFTDFEIVPSSVTVFGASAGEMMIPGVHKATGIDVVCAHLGIDRADTIAIGDSYNDVEMLEHAGVGIVMGNAPDEVKAVADEVTTSPDEDGVQLAFRRHGLIG